jgi:hypothetical protein
METGQPDAASVARANALYWESDRSVNQIADELELSKGMLYGLIRPLATPLACPRCSSALEYTNRTARERGLLTCAACGLEHEEAQVRARETPVAAPAAPPRPAPPAPIRVRGETTPPARRPRDPVMLGAGLLLIATGLWLFRGLGRR